jgi:hypothetical protein
MSQWKFARTGWREGSLWTLDHSVPILNLILEFPIDLESVIPPLCRDFKWLAPNQTADKLQNQSQPVQSGVGQSRNSRMQRIQEISHRHHWDKYEMEESQWEVTSQLPRRSLRYRALSFLQPPTVLQRVVSHQPLTIWARRGSFLVHYQKDKPVSDVDNLSLWYMVKTDLQ